MNSTINLAKMAKERNMKQVNIFEAKTDLSKLIKSLEDKTEDFIIIARNGHPVAKIIPIADAGSRIGIAKGIINLPDDFDIDFCNDEILEDFGLL